MKKILITIVLLPILLRLQAPPVDPVISSNRTEEWERQRTCELEYERFIKDLGYRESSNNPYTINRVGCFGEFQFKESTLQWLGYDITLREFRVDPVNIFPSDLQREAVDKLVSRNWEMLDDYYHLIDSIVGGVIISKSGLVAAAHLGGVGSVRKYLQSDGYINRKDIFGTSIEDYIKEFYGYNF